mgnify:CR=1 FL=1
MRIMIAILALVLISGVCFAAEQHAPKATEPIGAVIETLGVLSGKVIATCEQAVTGKTDVTVDSATGDTKIFPFGPAVEAVDKGAHFVTMDVFKPGDDVTVKLKNTLEKK